MIYFDQTITIRRLQLYSYSSDYKEVGAIKGIITPIKAEDVMLTEGDPVKQFKLYCDINEDLKEADKVVCDDVEYIVKTVRKFNFRRLARIEAFINKPNN
jgi:hypothetical protein